MSYESLVEELKAITTPKPLLRDKVVQEEDVDVSDELEPLDELNAKSGRLSGNDFVTIRTAIESNSTQFLRDVLNEYASLMKYHDDMGYYAVAQQIKKAMQVSKKHFG